MATLSSRMSRTMESILPKLSALKSPDTTLSDVVDLATADNSLCRDEVQDVVNRVRVEDAFALDHSFGGMESTRDAIASFFNTYFQPRIPLGIEHIVLTTGAGPCIEAISQALCEEGDAIIVPAPYWYSFEPYLYMRPKVIMIPARTPSIHSHFEDVLSAITAVYNAIDEPSRVKAVLLTNPHNPLSRVYTPDTIRACMRFCRERGMHFISDEVYALASLGGAQNNGSQFVSALAVSDANDTCDTGIECSHTHVVWSPSKLFGISGLRVGCLISQANPQLISAISLLTYLSTSSLSALALKELLSSPEVPTLLAQNRQRLSDNFSLFSDCFERLNVEYISPTNGLFVFARLGQGIATQEEEDSFFNKVLKSGVSVSRGRLYDNQSKEYGWARMTIAVKTDLAKLAVERLTKLLECRDKILC